ncbi:hypothetical protein NQ317_016183, partial [Molorchus minor]
VSFILISTAGVDSISDQSNGNILQHIESPVTIGQKGGGYFKPMELQFKISLLHKLVNLISLCVPKFREINKNFEKQSEDSKVIINLVNCIYAGCSLSNNRCQTFKYVVGHHVGFLNDFKYFLAKMVRKCQVCKKLDTFHPELSFHRFPVDPERRNVFKRNYFKKRIYHETLKNIDLSKKDRCRSTYPYSEVRCKQCATHVSKIRRAFSQDYSDRTEGGTKNILESALVFLLGIGNPGRLELSPDSLHKYKVVCDLKTKIRDSPEHLEVLKPLKTYSNPLQQHNYFSELFSATFHYER